MLKKLITTALATFLIITLITLCLPAASTIQNTKPSNKLSTPTYPGIGFALVLHHIEDRQLKHYLTAVDQIAEQGFTHLLLSTPMTSKNAHDAYISLKPSKGNTAKRKHIIAILNHANEKNLKTTLMPILWLKSHDKGWRGKLQPPNWKTWWANYQTAITYFAKIAQQTNTTTLSVGSELLSTESMKSQWTQTIHLTRKHFTGNLTYSANFDHYTYPTFWDQLDLIAINAYYDITTNGTSPANLKSTWQEIQTQILAYTKSKNKPLLITELGYPALPWGLEKPYDYTNNNNLKLDHSVQQKGYDAFINSWSPILNSPQGSTQLSAVHCYLWQPASIAGTDPPKDHPGYLHPLDLQGTKTLQNWVKTLKNRSNQTKTNQTASKQPKPTPNNPINTTN